MILRLLLLYYYSILDSCDNKLSVLDDKKMNIVKWRKNTLGYLPCRPTSPDIHVELFNAENKKIVHNKTELWKDHGKMIKFSQQTGFLISEIYKETNEETTLTCKFTHRNINNAIFRLKLQVIVTDGNKYKFISLEQ